MRFVLVGILMVAGVAMGGSGARAATVTPALNPICWQEEECLRARSGLTNGDQKQLKAGWKQNEGECKGAEWGKCLPATATVTEIHFFGKNVFTSAGDFLSTLYKYALIVAPILAAIMIIIAGFQWTMSGGNSEMITGAQHKIIGALTGLFIAYGSYFLLININPDLVNLRLPSVWLVRPQTSLPQFCSQMPEKIRNDKSFAYVASYEKQSSAPALPANPAFDMSLQDPGIENSKKFYCGNSFLVKGGGSNICYGNFCDVDNVCINTGKAGQKKYACVPGVLGGRVTGSFGFAKIAALDNGDNMILYAMCEGAANEEAKNDLIVKVAEIDYNGSSLNADNYVFEDKDKNFKTACGARKLAGFFIGVEVNDESALTGGFNAAEGYALSFGGDDWFAVGQTAPGSNNCSVNLSKVVKSLFPSRSTWCGEGNILCSCSLLSVPGVAYKMAQSGEFKKHLISLDELQSGYQCDIAFGREDFPSINNAFKWSELGDLVALGVQKGIKWGAVCGTVVGGAGAVGIPVLGAAAAVPAATFCSLAAGVSYTLVPGFFQIVRSIQDPSSCTYFQ